MRRMALVAVLAILVLTLSLPFWSTGAASDLSGDCVRTTEANPVSRIAQKHRRIPGRGESPEPPERQKDKKGNELPKPPKDKRRPVPHAPLLELPDAPLVKLSEMQKQEVRRGELHTIQLTRKQVRQMQQILRKLDSEKVNKRKTRRLINSLIDGTHGFDVKRAVSMAEDIYEETNGQRCEMIATVNGKPVDDAQLASKRPNADYSDWWATTCGPRKPGRNYPYSYDKYYSGATHDGGNTHPWGADHCSNADAANGVVGAYIKAWTGSAWATASQYVTFSTNKDTDIHVKALLDYRGTVKKINGLYPASTKKLYYSSPEGWAEQNITPAWTWKGVATGIIETALGCVPYYHIGDVADAIFAIKDIGTAAQIYQESQKHGNHETKRIAFDFSVDKGEPFTVGVGVRADGASVLLSTLYATAWAQVEYIRIQQEEWLKPDFTYSPAHPVKGEPITFKSKTKSSKGLLSRDWNFGDGAGSSGKRVTHTFSEPGSYKVRLRANDGWDSATRTKTVEVKCDKPKADFDFHPSNPEPGAEVHFTNNSDGKGDAITDYEWHFGNEQSSSKMEPVVTYEREGNFRVTLIITDDEGCKDSITKRVQVQERSGNAPPEADFSWQPYAPQQAEDVHFQCDATDPDGNIAQYQWDFGDGTGSTQENPTHAFGTRGPHEVTLTVTDSGGLSDKVTKTVSVVTGGGMK